MNQATKLAIPQLNAGEVYGGAFIQPDGTGHHTIILPGDNDDSTFDDALEWAKSNGGDLPDRVEQAAFYKHLPERFQKDWYWSNAQREAGSAWCQVFDDGHQTWDGKLYKCRAVSVRRESFSI